MRKRELRARRVGSVKCLNERLLRCNHGDPLLSLRIRCSYEPRFRLQINIPAGFQNLQMSWARWTSIKLSAYLAGRSSDNATVMMSVGATNKQGEGTVASPQETGRSIAVAVNAGAMSLTLQASGDSVDSNTWYFLRDVDKVEQNDLFDPPGERNIGGELIKTTTVSSTTADVETSITQPYPNSTSVRLTPLPPNSVNFSATSVARNIEICNARFRGRNGTLNSSWVSAYYANRFALKHCKGIRAGTSGFEFVYCSEVSIEYCSATQVFANSVLRPINPDDTPYIGFAYLFVQSVRCTAKRFSSTESVYAAIFDGGCAKFTCEELSTGGVTQGSFDVHGGDSYDGLAKFVSSSETQIQIGNPGWRRGCRKVVVEDSTAAFFTAKAWVRGGGNEKCKFIRCKGKFAGLFGTKPDPSIPTTSGGPEGVEFNACTFTSDTTNPQGGRGAVWLLGSEIDGTKYGKFVAEFIGCTLTSTQANHGVVDCGLGSGTSRSGRIASTSSFTFQDCTLEATANQVCMMWRVEADYSSQMLNVFLYNCVFKVKASSPAQLVGEGSGVLDTGRIRVLYEGEECDSVRQPSPATPDNPTSTRPLQTSDFTGLTFTEA